MSRSWKLVGLDGTPDLNEGRADISFDDSGHIQEVSGRGLLSQRVRACALGAKGRRLLSREFGSYYHALLGQKDTDTEIFLYVHTQRMIEDLIALQSEVARRVDLDDSEVIERLLGVELDRPVVTHFQLAVSLLTSEDELEVQLEV